MTRPKNVLRTSLTYLLMVVAPLCGLMLILHYGATLHAPGAVGGRWQVVETGTEVIIEQSGRYVRGHIEGQPFEALIEPRGSDQLVSIKGGRCAGLRAHLREVPDGWRVELSGSDCVRAEASGYTLARVE